MNGENSLEMVNVLISRDELLFVLNALEADYIPGLDPEPLGELSADQQTLALTVAGRALRARGLTREHVGGEMIIHNGLLASVGVCAYAQNALFAYYWPTGDEAPRRFFGHLRGENVVAHTRPEDVLHLFTLLPSRDRLIDGVLAFCEYEDGPASAALEFALSNEDLASVRELAGTGEVDKAVDLLASRSVPAEAAQAFVDTLAHSPRVTIMQAVKQPGNGSLQKRDFTLLQNGGQTWLVIASTDPSAASLLVKTTTQEGVRTLLTEWL